MGKCDYKFEIMKVNENSESFKDLTGMEVIVLNFDGNSYKNNTILSPLRFDDYDKFFKWLFKAATEHNVALSETFEEFKEEVAKDTDEILPSIIDYLKEFDYVRDCLVEDMQNHTKYFREYFKECMKIEE